MTTAETPKPTSRPMCWSWYERAGDYRPWHGRIEYCRCGCSAHHLPWQHGEHCPVRQNYDRDQMDQRQQLLIDLAPQAGS